MAYKFLTPEWIDAVKALRDESGGGGSVPHTVRMNQIVTDVPFGDGTVEAHMDTSSGQLEMDLGHLDSEGYLYLSGRRTDLILSGGVNIYPQEIENVLATHPAVADVAVIGVAHEVWGESPLAIVVLREGRNPNAEEIRAWANARLGKTQRIAAVVLRPDFPRNALGKVQKGQLREEYRQYRQAEARRRTEELDAQVATLQGVLTAGCQVPAFRASSLMRAEEVPPFDPGQLAWPVRMPDPSQYQTQGGWTANQRAQAQAEAQARFERDWYAAQAAEAQRQQRLAALQRDYEQRTGAQRAEVRRHNAGVVEVTGVGVCDGVGAVMLQVAEAAADTVVRDVPTRISFW